MTAPIDVTVVDQTIDVDVVDQVVQIDIVEQIVQTTITEEIAVTVVDTPIEVIVQDDQILVEIQEAVTASEADVAYLTRIDDQTAADGSGFIYRGKAQPGSLDSQAVWQIERLEITIDVGNRDDIDNAWADGNANFDNIWDDRLGLSYS